MAFVCHRYFSSRRWYYHLRDGKISVAYECHHLYCFLIFYIWWVPDTVCVQQIWISYLLVTRVHVWSPSVRGHHLSLCPGRTMSGQVHPHDDVIKRKHFPYYWPFMQEIHQSPVNSHHKGQWPEALIFSLICARTIGWANNRYAGDLICHRAHYMTSL